MKKIIYMVAASVLFIGCAEAEAESTEENPKEVVEETNENEETEVEEKKKPKSPRRQASGEVSGVQVEVDYGSPYVKGRTIWGELVSYDKMWRAGANQTTAITFEGDVSINGTELKAGTYGLFIIPKETENWTVVLNEKWDEEEHGMWGTYGYDEAKDVVRFEVTPEKTEENSESMTFTVENNTINFAWELITFSFGFDE